MNGVDEMSFSNDVRKEICASINDKDKRFACLYGMILFGRTADPGHICFQSESQTSAEMFRTLFESVLKFAPECTRNTRRSGSVLYSYDITAPDILADAARKFRLKDGARSIDQEIISTSSLGVFAAGVFLSCGSVNDPSKAYHLEFTVPEEGLAAELVMLLGDIGVTAGTVQRRGQYIVYIKGSESIEDTLTFIGAQQCTLDLMNVKIFKDVRNKANRIANCDSANIDKVVNAAMRQIEDIKLIEQTNGLDSLPSELREVAELRLDNIDMSLQEIGESLSVPISRSGVNHRFQRLAKLAEEIRGGGA
jgi:DNA-binding protein WhiA